MSNIRYALHCYKESGLMMEVWHFNSCHQRHLAISSYIEPLAIHANLTQRLSNPTVRRQSLETFTAHVACMCWEFVSSSFLTVQLTLSNGRASKCWPPASQALNLLTIFLHARRSTFWNIKNLSSLLQVAVEYLTTPRPLNILCGAGNFGKIWYACGQRGLQFTEWRMAHM
jgi:hypothetical protein